MEYKMFEWQEKSRIDEVKDLIARVENSDDNGWVTLKDKEGETYHVDIDEKEEKKEESKQADKPEEKKEEQPKQMKLFNSKVKQAFCEAVAELFAEKVGE